MWFIIEQRNALSVEDAPAEATSVAPSSLDPSSSRRVTKPASFQARRARVVPRHDFGIRVVLEAVVFVLGYEHRLAGPELQSLRLRRRRSRSRTPGTRPPRRSDGGEYSCFEPGGKKVTPNTVFELAPTVSTVIRAPAWSMTAPSGSPASVVHKPPAVYSEMFRSPPWLSFLLSLNSVRCDCTKRP